MKCLHAVLALSAALAVAAPLRAQTITPSLDSGAVGMSVASREGEVLFDGLITGGHSHRNAAVELSIETGE